MAQFFTWRFWMAVLVLVGLALLVVIFVVRPGDDEPAAAGGAADRRIDLGAIVALAETEAGWAIRDGSTTGEARFTLDDATVMYVAPGTPAASTCDALAQLGGCAVLADMLGQAVVWMQLVPAGTDGEVVLPPIESLLEGGREARLTNGWIVPLVDRMERRCDQETTSLRDFLAKLGTNHQTIYDLTLDEASAVAC